MENVVRLAEYRQRRKHARRRTAAKDAGPQYYCTRCDNDEFRLHASGAVHCAQCGALMANIGVATAAEAKP